MINLDESCKKTNQKYLELLDITKQIGNDRAKMIQFNPIINEKILEIEKETGDLDTIHTYQKLGFEGTDLEEVMLIKERALNSIKDINKQESVGMLLGDFQKIYQAFPDLRNKILDEIKDKILNLKNLISNEINLSDRKIIDYSLSCARILLNGTSFEMSLDKTINSLVKDDYLYDEKSLEKGTLGAISDWGRQIAIHKKINVEDHILEMEIRNQTEGNNILNFRQRILEMIATDLPKYTKKDDSRVYGPHTVILGVEYSRILLGEDFQLDGSLKKFVGDHLNEKFRETKEKDNSTVACSYLGQLRLLSGENEEIAKNVYGTSFTGLLDKE